MSAVSSERWREVERLFAAAVSLPRDERAAYVSKECGDATLRKDVEELLAADEESGVQLSELGRAATSIALLRAQTLADEEVASVRAPARDLVPGQLLAGKFRIERVLGRGGFGTVVEATHVDLDERVAVKLLHAAALDNESIRERFIAEARTAARVKSEHIVRVRDVGRLDDGAPYLVMELLDGRDLHAVLAEHGALALRDAALIVLQACEGLAAAHAASVVHRDIKPGNLFLSERPDGTALVKLLDFGISKELGSDAGLTQSSMLLGSPSYMSPEQLRSSRDVDARTDIWALGVVLYRALTGKLPFVAGSIADLCIDVLTKPFAPMRSLRADLPAHAEEVVARCLEKDRDQRFSDVAELAAALAPLGGRLGVESAARAARILGAAPPPTAVWQEPAVTAPPERAGRRLALAALALIVTAGAGWLGWRSAAPATGSVATAQSGLSTELPALEPATDPPYSSLPPPASAEPAPSETPPASATAITPAAPPIARPPAPAASRDPYAGRN
jgi:serine/threonine-protein kinase